MTPVCYDAARVRRWGMDSDDKTGGSSTTVRGDSAYRIAVGDDWAEVVDVAPRSSSRQLTWRCSSRPARSSVRSHSTAPTTMKAIRSKAVQKKDSSRCRGYRARRTGMDPLSAQAPSDAVGNVSEISRGIANPLPVSGRMRLPGRSFSTCETVVVQTPHATRLRASARVDRHPPSVAQSIE